uniref:EF-hand domain-containing protein n=1 Tax=Chromera velia CCMP2878 TaxID=1169474 RepID=A0A0G4HSQ7_9ALVE|eukprot:Cvel_31116.t1-p1 / transcript=Cvel_31116.t1 / gene=Cvel_31116 / organism=Chromera_velia_CCMP2878 / gene_product=Tubulin polymerization-promoting protein family, putative / transcript_product=Tubulin polymerization-promoting protein family, putative / location=Cvel_scaffold4572:5510-8258(-) / protein_length=499 / sequence_SO=supercontig / SO=protein_coding / is_pseudo=false
MDDLLHQKFLSFTARSDEIDGRTWVKFCRDCRLFDKKFSQTDADLMFAKVKPKGGRKVGFADFGILLDQVAAKKKCSVETLTDLISSAEGPVLTGTKTESVKWYDDKTTFTGVHAQGGPTTVDAGRTMMSDLSQFADRTSADVRGVKMATRHETHPSLGASGRLSLRTSTASQQQGQDDATHAHREVRLQEADYAKRRQSRNSQGRPSALAEDMKALRISIGSHGRQSLQQSQQQNGLQSSRRRSSEMRTSQGASTFTPEGPPPRTMTEKLFEWLDIDGDCVISMTEFIQAVQKAQALIPPGNPLAERMQPDLKTFQTIDSDGNGVIDRPELGAWLRHVVKFEPIQEISLAIDLIVSENKEVAKPSEDWQVTQLLSVFLAFAGGQPEMDGRQFAKLCRDSELCNGTDADLAFAQAKSGPTVRRLSFLDFQRALGKLAERTKGEVDQVVAQVIASGGPVFVGTRAEAVRFHDDKSTYTGVYKQGGPDSGSKGSGTVAVRP